MNKIVIGGIAVVTLAAAAYFGAGFLAKSGGGTAATSSLSVGAAGQTSDPNQPDRTAEVKGTVVSVNGTTVVVDRLLWEPSEELTDAEKAAKRAERQAMSMEDRQAAKAAEQAGLATERVSVDVPVGVTMTSMIPGEDQPTAQPATLSDLRAGVTVSIWTDGKTDGGVAEYVKIQVGN
jgi:hypothetical protein